MSYGEISSGFPLEVGTETCTASRAFVEEDIESGSVQIINIPAANVQAFVQITGNGS